MGEECEFVAGETCYAVVDHLSSFRFSFSFVLCIKVAVGGLYISFVSHAVYSLYTRVLYLKSRVWCQVVGSRCMGGVGGCMIV